MSRFTDLLNKVADAFVKSEVKEVPGPESGPPVLKAGTHYSNVPAKWRWITAINGLPKIVSEGLKEYGTIEFAGTANNSHITHWADEIESLCNSTYNSWAADWYTQDSVPWCGLFVGLLAARSANANPARFPVKSYLSSLAWANWCTGVLWQTNINNIWMGDVAVFTRTDGGHVGVVIGVSTDGEYIVVLGGNQSDAVNITLVAKSRLYAVRRPTYSIRPLGAKHYRISTTGVPISTNEA